MLEVKTTLTEMKNEFGGLISRPYMTEERIYELEDMPIQTEKRKKIEKKRIQYTRIVG